MLRVNTASTVKGIDSNSVGSTETLATNQLWIRNSRHANGRRGMDTKVSKASAKNSPSARSGLDATSSETTAHALLSVAKPAVSAARGPRMRDEALGAPFSGWGLRCPESAHNFLLRPDFMWPLL